jgi:hypothetical protein
MIILDNVSKYYPTKFGRNYVLRYAPTVVVHRTQVILRIGISLLGRLAEQS